MSCNHTNTTRNITPAINITSLLNYYGRHASKDKTHAYGSSLHKVSADVNAYVQVIMEPPASGSYEFGSLHLIFSFMNNFLYN